MVTDNITASIKHYDIPSLAGVEVMRSTIRLRTKTLPRSLRSPCQKGSAGATTNKI